MSFENAADVVVTHAEVHAPGRVSRLAAHQLLPDLQLRSMVLEGLLQTASRPLDLADRCCSTRPPLPEARCFQGPFRASPLDRKTGAKLRRGRRRSRAVPAARSRCCCARTPARAPVRPARVLRDEPFSDAAVGSPVLQGAFQVPPAPADGPDPEMALGQLVQAFAVGGAPLDERFRQVERLLERLAGRFQVALRDAHAADLVEGLRAPQELLVAERLDRHRGEVRHGFRRRRRRGSRAGPRARASP